MSASAFWQLAEPLVLASKSATRLKLLADAGVPVEPVPSEVDERAVEAPAMAQGADAAHVARLLAEAKAREVAARRPGRLVVGADQTLACEGRRFTKPADPAAGRRQLEALAGRTHVLSSGVALARDGSILWSCVGEARLTMRELGVAFLDAYVAMTGASVLSSVGGYHYEGFGAQLFAAVEGDFSTILGMPLLPLLEALRREGALLS